MAVTAISNLIDIVTRDPLYNVINSPENYIITKKVEFGSMLNLSTTYTDYLRDSIQENQAKLDQINNLFVSSVIRIFACLLILLNPFFIHVFASNVGLIELITLNALFVVPAPTKWIVSYVWAPERKSGKKSRIGLFQELASENNKSRWNIPDLLIWEKLLFALASILSIISVLIGLLGFLL